MKRLIIFVFIFFASNAYAAEKPNILVIWGDDIGWMNVSAYNRGMMESRGIGRHGGVDYGRPVFTGRPRAGKMFRMRSPDSRPTTTPWSAKPAARVFRRAAGSG